MKLKQLVTACVVTIVAAAALPCWASVSITLQPSSNPSQGQPNAQMISVFASNVPSGTISPGSVTIAFQPVDSSAGASGSTAPTAVTLVYGSTRRFTFQIPPTVAVLAPTDYRISISGITSGGISFASQNTSALKVLPFARVLSVSSTKGTPGDTLDLTLTGDSTNWVNGATQVSFGPGVSVGGASDGAFGPVSVESPTSAIAHVVILSSAALGFRDINFRTGVQTGVLARGFFVRRDTIIDHLPAPPAIGIPQCFFNGPPDQVGEWEQVGNSQILAVHAALLHTGKIVYFSGSSNDPTNLPTLSTFRGWGVRLWNTQTDAVQALPDTPDDVFCAGHSFMSDGRLLVAGGNLRYDPFYGLKDTNIFDPATETFTRVQDMQHGRWYPSNISLANGTVMTIEGLGDLDSGDTNHDSIANDTFQYYTPGSGWGAEHDLLERRDRCDLLSPFISKDFCHTVLVRYCSLFFSSDFCSYEYHEFEAGLYPYLHLLPDSRVLYAGPYAYTYALDTTTNYWTYVGDKNSGPLRDYGNSVLLPLNPPDYSARVLAVGGTPGGNPGPGMASAEILDMSQPSPAWRFTNPMSFARVQNNGTLLPDGTVLVTGGAAQDHVVGSGELQAELFNPATETWTTLAASCIERHYHSIAILQPDGRVWVAGSNPQRGDEEYRVEVFSPPYMFKGYQPTISYAPSTVYYGSQFRITVSGLQPNTSIARVALLRPGSVTHSRNMDQRYVGLSIVQQNSDGLLLQMPGNANLLPGGYYMLFAVDSNGVPSVAAWVLVTTQPIVIN